MKRIIFIAFLIVITLLPVSSADPVPTLNCVKLAAVDTDANDDIILPRGSRGSPDLSTAVEVLPETGNLIFIETTNYITAGNERTDSVFQIIKPETCTPQTQTLSYECPGGFNPIVECFWQAPTFDPSGHATLLANTQTSGGLVSATYGHISKNTGFQLNGVDSYIIPTADAPRSTSALMRKNPTGSCSFLRDGVVYTAYASGQTSSTSENGVAGRLIVVSDSTTDEIYTGASQGTSPQDVTCGYDATSNIYATFGASSESTVPSTTLTWRKIDTTTEPYTVSAGLNGGASNQDAVNLKAPRQYGDTKLRVIQETASTTLRWYQIDIATWAIDSDTLFTGWNANNLVRDFDVAGNGDFLICGSDTGTGSGKVWYGNTATNAITTLITTETGVSLGFCRFDFNGGFWLGGSSITDAVCAAAPSGSPPGNVGFGGADNPCFKFWHYNSGGFTTPTMPPIDDTIYSNPDGGPVAPPPVAGGFDAAVQFFSDSWGIDLETAGWLFGILVLGLIAFKFGEKGPMFAGVGIFLGVGVSTLLGLFPVWVLFVIIFLIIAVAGYRLFTPSGKDEE